MAASSLPAGTRGFDCNAPVTYDVARSFIALGYRFACRYVPRVTAHQSDLRAGEVAELMRAGLAIMPVQHVESEAAWTPTDDKGRQYGETAAKHASMVGIDPGTTLWLDLEGVAPGTPAEDVIRYCNYWHDRVKAAGYLPGIYVGWHSMLSPLELYRRLKFQRYWAAYNLNVDQFPATRGVCLRQVVAKPNDKPSGVPFEIDVDVARADIFGGLATVHAPDEWAV